MLRITPIEADPYHRELRVEGRLAGEPAVELLRGELEQAASSERPVVLELSGVSFADQQAVALLVEAAQRGVVLVGGSAWLSSLLGGVGP
jgi:anti-anti-sigma regulatory factor